MKREGKVFESKTSLTRLVLKELIVKRLQLGIFKIEMPSLKEKLTNLLLSYQFLDKLQ